MNLLCLFVGFIFGVIWSKEFSYLLSKMFGNYLQWKDEEEKKRDDWRNYVGHN